MFVSGRPAYPNVCKKMFCVYSPMISTLIFDPSLNCFCAVFKHHNFALKLAVL